MKYFKPIFLIVSLLLIFSVTHAETPKAVDTKAVDSKAVDTRDTKAETLPKYEVGSGNKYQLTLGKDVSEVTIAFVESTADKVVVEIFMDSKTDSSKLGVKMWQQFQLGLVKGKVGITKGILKIPQIGKSQILPAEYLQGYSGVQMKSFLIGSAGEMSGKKIGTEKITADGKTFECTHYRQGENSQTVDYWVSDDAKPVGLVKLSSAGSGSNSGSGGAGASSGGMNYSMIYTGRVSGIKSQINASEAEPMNDMMKAFLPMLGPALFQF